MSPHPAIERIAFQHHSPLARKMIAACQGFIDWVEKTRPAPVQGVVPLVSKQRIQAAVGYASKTFAPVLVKLCADELNLKIKPVVFTDITAFDGMMLPCYQTMVNTKDWHLLQIGEALYSGIADATTVRFDAAFFTKMASQLDLTTSQLKVHPDTYFIELYLFPCVFLNVEIYANCPKFTAEQQAAVFIHELGHAVSTLEHMGELYHRAETATKAIQYLATTTNAAVLTQAVTGLTTAATDLPKDATDALTAVTKPAPTHGIASAFIPILTIGGVVAAIVTFVLGKLLLGVLLKAISRTLDARIDPWAHDTDVKTSDTVVTLSNVGYDERIADEFTSRHGLGAALASALATARQIDMGKVLSRIVVNDTNTIKVLAFGLLMLSQTFGPMLYGAGLDYDPLWLRLEHLLNNNLLLFHDDTLSPELRDRYLRDTKDLITLVENYKSSKSRKLYQTFWGTIMRILSRSSVVDAFTTANLSNDYDKLQLLTNGLIANRLGYQAARLKAL